MDEKIKLGISTCLLGEKVRYDGGHKLNRYLVNVVGQFVEWVPVCPEAECGLPIPRESMRLVHSSKGPRLMTRKSKIDHTDLMMKWAAIRLRRLEKENLCGYIFKSKSPSSGMRDINIYNEKGMPQSKSSGLFAQAFMERFSILPVEDEGRLNDAGLRENFIERVFVYHRWMKLTTNGASRKRLVDFHTDHKLLIMSHSPKHLRMLGKIVAEPQKRSKSDLVNEYVETLMEGLKLKATVRKNTNVLHHAMGYFKKILTADEKQELLGMIDQYHKSLIPLIVPVTLLRHYVRKYDAPYLKRQYYLNPHPVELMLRNHV
jgi:uncharacterized protein YbgA (DUF1722 family)/uncharacterized protein YbbK (DUF523 family)